MLIPKAVPQIKLEKRDSIEALEIVSGMTLNYREMNPYCSLKYITHKETDQYWKLSCSGGTPLYLQRQIKKMSFAAGLDSNLYPFLGWGLRREISRGRSFSLKSNVGFGPTSWQFTYKQNDHKVSLPIILTPTVGWQSLLWVLMMPIAWTAINYSFLYSFRYYRYNMKQRSHVVKRVTDAKRVQESLLMHRYTNMDHRLNIMEARYGRNVKSDKSWDDATNWYNWMDVKIPLQISIEESSEGPRLELKNLNILGVADTAPKDEKQVFIEYTFRGKKHKVTFQSHETIKIPQANHCVE